MDDVDKFIAKFGESERAELERIRQVVREAVPDAEEAISYGIPAFKYKKKYLVGYCAYKDHLSLFPASRPIAALRDRLVDYKLSKGTIQFTLANPLPAELIREIVAIRLAEIVSPK